MNPVNVLKFWSDLREACLKSGIVIAEKPDLVSVRDRPGYLGESFLADFQLFLDRWARFPTDGGMPTDSAAVNSVTVADDSGGVESDADLYKRAVGD